MVNKSDVSRDVMMLRGGLARCGYDWWWHSFTGRHSVTGQEKSFFLEFFLCNPASGGPEPTFGQLPENQQAGRQPSYLMVKAGAWGEDACQLHRFFGWQQVRLSPGTPFAISAGDCSLSETASRGQVSVSPEAAQAHPEYLCQAGSMSWQLDIRKQVAFHVGYGAGRLLRRLQAFEMFWHAEGMKTAYSGQVIWNGETYLVTPETCYGYADKNWGKNFTSPWVWLSSCCLTSRKSGQRLENSVFDIGGGRPKIGPLALSRKLLALLWYEGRDYEFNFSKFWTFCRTDFSCQETDTEILWHVEQKTLRYRMVTAVRCQKREMLFVNYEAPDGSKRHNRLWNGGNGIGTIDLYQRRGNGWQLLDSLDASHIGCEYGEYDPDQQKSAAHAEIT